MSTEYHDRRDLLTTLLADTRGLVVQAGPADQARPTPCEGWSVADLLAHMIGQNSGFAAAVGTGTAPVEAYAARPAAPADVVGAWDGSAARLRSAFEAADAAGPVHLAEFGVDVTADDALGMQLLDAAVHAWDLARGLGDDYRPPDLVVALVLGHARRIAAAGATGVFAEPLPEAGDDDWADALRLLGRDPGW